MNVSNLTLFCLERDFAFGNFAAGSGQDDSYGEETNQAENRQSDIGASEDCPGLHSSDVTAFIIACLGATVKGG